MGVVTRIEWCDHTFNPWIGCTKISPACDHCYAESLALRYKWAEWGAGKPRHRTSPPTWRKLLAWDAAAGAAGVRRRVFIASLADWADKEVPDQWRADLFALIRQTRYLDILLLTKRHALAARILERWAADLSDRIRIGFTIEAKASGLAGVRLYHLDQLARAGWQTFVSYEPALGPVDWLPWLQKGTIGWLIAGGESGAQARAPHPDWFRAARDACTATGVPFHFKQWGEWAPLSKPVRVPFGHRTPKGLTLVPRHGYCDGDGVVSKVVLNGTYMRRVGKGEAGAMLDGREWREFPAPMGRP